LHGLITCTGVAVDFVCTHQEPDTVLCMSRTARRRWLWKWSEASAAGQDAVPCVSGHRCVLCVSGHRCVLCTLHWDRSRMYILIVGQVVPDVSVTPRSFATVGTSHIASDSLLFSQATGLKS